MTCLKGEIKRLKIYPIVMNASYIVKVYKRENSKLGRLYNDIEYKGIRWIFR